MSLPAVATMSEHDARRITERIRLTAFTARESLEKLQALVAEAQEGQAHVALGYASWTAYLADVLGEEPLRLPRDQRQALVGYLAGEGMSTRAIAPIVGVDNATVHRDLRRVADATPENNPSDVAIGGEVTPLAEALTTPAQPVADDAAEEQPGEAVEVHPSPPARPVVGLDGKTYTKPSTPKPPRRRPLTDGFFTAVYDTRKKVESLHRLTQDDRFPQNAEKVAQAHLNDLIRTRDLLEQVITSLKKEVTA